MFYFFHNDIITMFLLFRTETLQTLSSDLSFLSWHSYCLRCSMWVFQIPKSWYYNISMGNMWSLQIKANLSQNVAWCSACTCNPATLEAKFRNSVGSIPVWVDSPSIDEWIVWPPAIVIQDKDRILAKYWNLTGT